MLVPGNRHESAPWGTGLSKRRLAVLDRDVSVSSRLGAAAELGVGEGVSTTCFFVTAFCVPCFAERLRRTPAPELRRRCSRRSSL